MRSYGRMVIRSNAFKLLMKISSSKKFPQVIASMAIICVRILFQGDGGRLEQVLDDELPVFTTEWE